MIFYNFEKRIEGMFKTFTTVIQGSFIDLYVWEIENKNTLTFSSFHFSRFHILISSCFQKIETTSTRSNAFSILLNWKRYLVPGYLNFVIIRRNLTIVYQRAFKVFTGKRFVKLTGGFINLGCWDRSLLHLHFVNSQKYFAFHFCMWARSCLFYFI